MDAHNAHRLVCVSMAFDTMPWYGAHATDATIEHEAYTAGFHWLLESLAIPHHYDNTLSADHRWHQQWMQPALEALMPLADAGH